MGRAVLEIAGDTGPLMRALGQIPGRVKKAADAIRGEFRGAMEDATESAEKAAVAHQRAAAAMRAASKAAGKAAGDEQKAQTRIVQQESNYRTSAVRQEVRAVETAEKSKTRAVQQEARKREQAAAREMAERRRTVGNVGRAVGDGAVSFGRDAVGMTRDALRDAGAIESRMNDALVPAGYSTERERATGRAAIAARASSMGVGSGELADALSNAQESTSLLSGRTEEARTANLQEALRTAEMAHSARQRPQDLLELSGVLRQQGVSDTDIRAASLQSTGMGRAGAAEIGNLVRQGRGGLMRNIAFATGRLGPNATAAERSTAVRGALSRSLAVTEVAVNSGLSVRDSLNAGSKLDRLTLNDNAMGKLRDRLMGRGAAGVALAGRMFEEGRDAGGNRVQRLRSAYRGDGIAMSSALLEHTGGDSAELSNMLASSGPGRAMVADSQIRGLLLGLSSQTNTGETMSARVLRMQREGDSYGEGNLAADAAVRAGEQQTTQTRNEEERRKALTDSTSALVLFTQTVDRFSSAHPLAAAGIGAAVVAGGATSLAVGGGLAIGLAIGEGINQLGARITGQRNTPSLMDAATWRDLGGLFSGDRGNHSDPAADSRRLREAEAMRAAVAGGVREGMATAPVQVPVAAAQHARTEEGLRTGGRPTTSR